MGALLACTPRSRGGRRIFGETPYHLLAEALGHRQTDSVRELVARYPKIYDLADATPEELQTVPGVGPKTAKRIAAIFRLGRQSAVSAPSYGQLIGNHTDVGKLMIPMLNGLDREQVMVILLNTKHRVISVEIVSIGTLTNSPVHPREAFKSAVRRSAASVIFAHNHPSGMPDPSPDDIALTRRLVEVGELLGIEVLDHVIIGGTTYVSLSQCGHIK